MKNNYKLLFFIVFFMTFSTVCIAAEEPQASKQAATHEAGTNGSKATNSATANDAHKETRQRAENPGEYSCEYFTVNLPNTWTVYLPPSERQGTINALFGSNNENVTVTIIVIPSANIELNLVAEMFADQFNATKKPSLKNGQYIFSFTKNNRAGNVWIAKEDNAIMVTAVIGDQKEGLDFLKKNVKSNFPALLPKQ